MIVKTEDDMQFVKENFNQIQHKLQTKDSLAESHFEKLLNKAKIPHSRERGNYKYDTRWCYYDFYIPSIRLYVEIDGKEHESIKQKEIDNEKFKIIRRKNCFLLRLKNEYVLSLKEISLQILKELTSKHRNKSFKTNFNKNVKENIEQAIKDMRRTANFNINETQEIYTYDNKTGEYYHFDNIFLAKISTKFTINELHDLLEMENKYSPMRRYVFGYTLQECENNVLIVFG